MTETLNRDALVQHLFEMNVGYALGHDSQYEGSRELDEARDEADLIIRILTK